jgi:hypothetical protein
VGHRIGDLSFTSDHRRCAWLEFKTEGDPTLLKLADLNAQTIQEIAAGKGAPDITPRQKETVGVNWSYLALSPMGNALAATVASVVEGTGDASSPPDEDHHDDDGETPVYVDPDTIKPLILRLPQPPR